MIRCGMLGGVALLVALGSGGAARHAETATGPSILGTITVGAGPIVVDEQTGRAFVLHTPTVGVLDTHGGTLLRTVVVAPRPIDSCFALALDGRAGLITVACGGSSVAVLDARTGQLLQVVRGVSSVKVAVDRRTGHAFFIDALRLSVSVVDLRSGRLLQTVHLNGAPYDVAVDEQTGRVFIKSDGGVYGEAKLVNILDTRSGRLLRTVTVGHDPRGLVSRGVPNSGIGNLLVDERSGRVFVPTLFSDSVSVLDARSGRVLRTIGSLRPETMTLDVGSGHVFVLSRGGGAVDMLNGTSGQRLRTIAVGRSTGLPVAPVVDTQAGRVFVANTADGTVSVLDSRSGATVRTVAVGTHPAAIAVDSRSGRVFVTMLGAMDRAGNLTGNGSVSVLDSTSGMVLRTLPVGVEPALVAVDERAGRAFVVNMAGTRAFDARDALPPWVPVVPRQKPPCTSDGQSGMACRPVPGSVTVLDATR